MSLDIDVDHVAAVLIHGYWHRVLDDSFEVDEYTFTYEGKRLAISDQTGQTAANPGFRFTTPIMMSAEGLTKDMLEHPPSQIMAGPLSAIEAIRYPKTIIREVTDDEQVGSEG